MENTKKKKQKNSKPLTLETLATYNQEVLFPALEERFVTKNEFQKHRNEFQEHRNEFQDLKKEFEEFKDETLTNEDKILKKLDILLTEKKVREYHEEKEKKLWAIIIKALREHRILSSKELKEIAQLEIF